eukprot:EG_transcript_26037
MAGGRMAGGATTRYHCFRLLQGLDLAGVFVPALMDPTKVHIYLPRLWSRRAKVFRDFITCPRRHRQPKPSADPVAHIHIKTNVPAVSKVMYRFLVEGYNYGYNAPINSEIVGCTKWKPGPSPPLEPGPEGYPPGWNGFNAMDHAPGAHISQYYSSDGYLVLLLAAESFFSAGFG